MAICFPPRACPRALAGLPMGLLMGLGLVLATPAGAKQESTVRVGDVEMHCVAIPAAELIPDAAQEFNVRPTEHRGVLTITLIRHLGAGNTRAEAGQVFAGAINLRNQLSSIPVREVRRGDAVYYLGEYRVEPPDTLRFRVNATVGARSLTADFIHEFPATAP